MSPVTAGLLVALGLLPSLVWMFFFYHQDCHPEPKYLITKTFLMGIIISPVAVLLQIGFNQVGYWTPLNALIAQGSLFFLWAAFIEEFIKYYAVRIIALTDSAFDEPVDAMVYMIIAGLGFAAIENILVLFRTFPTAFKQLSLSGPCARWARPFFMPYPPELSAISWLYPGSFKIIAKN